MKRHLAKLGVGLLGLALFVAGMIALQGALHLLHLGALAGYALALPIEIALYAGIVRLTQRRSVSELQLRACLPQSGVGFLAGILIFSAAVAALVICGCYRVTGHSAFTVIFAPLLVWTSAAVMEELLFRGFIFRVVESVAGTWIALGASSLLFGIAHALNPGATLWSSIAIALQAGVLLGLAYTITQRLWLPIGMHIGWNFAEGTLYGTPVSGFPFPGSLLHGALRGPEILTGGTFGVEASLEATLACVAASVVLYGLAVRKRRIAPAGVNAAPLVEQSPI